MTYEERKEKLRVQFEKDVEYFSELLEDMDSKGFFNDRLPNYGEEYGEEDMLDSILHFEDYCSNPENLAFAGFGRDSDVT
jgi:hypothetical protein